MAKGKSKKPKWLIERKRKDRLSQFQPEPQATLDSLVVATPAPAYATDGQAPDFSDSSETGLYQMATIELVKAG